MTLNPFHGTGFFLCLLKISGKVCFSDAFQEIQRETSTMKWVKDIFNKHISIMLIFMLVPQQSMLSYSQTALVLSMQSRGIKFQDFLI